MNYYTECPNFLNFTQSDNSIREFFLISIFLSTLSTFLCPLSKFLCQVDQVDVATPPPQIYIYSQETKLGFGHVKVILQNWAKITCIFSVKFWPKLVTRLDKSPKLF